MGMLDWQGYNESWQSDRVLMGMSVDVLQGRATSEAVVVNLYEMDERWVMKGVAKQVVVLCLEQ
jgi:hypothetical protein